MISIVIPMYNVKDYIEHCLRSFENQNYKDFEIIVVDDGSTDGSANVVTTYIEKSNLNMTLLRQVNSGVSAARNRGIEHAKGQYLCFVDADDMATPSYLSGLLDALSQKQCEVAICSSMLVPEERHSNMVERNQYTLRELTSSEALDGFLFRRISPGIWSILLKSELIRENGLFFEEGFRYSEDIDFIFKVLAHARRVVCTDAKWYLYRVRNTSAMSSVDEKRMDGLRLMRKLEGYFDKLNPEFAKKFRTYGVARWVWSTLWQHAVASRSYREFISSSRSYEPRHNMRKLLTCSDIKVSTSALLFLISPYICYCGIKLVYMMTFRRRVYY